MGRPYLYAMPVVVLASGKRPAHTARTPKAFSGFISSKKLSNLFTLGLNNQSKNMIDCYQYLKNSTRNSASHIGQCYYVLRT